MKNSADRGRWITPSSICRVLHILGKPNSIIIVFLLIQNISKFKNRLKHATVLLKSKLMLETRDSIFASWSSNASSFRMLGSRCLEFRSSRIQKARFSERMMLYSHVAVQIFAPSISAVRCGAVFESSGFAKLSISLNQCFHFSRFILHVQCMQPLLATFQDFQVRSAIHSVN